MEYDYNKREIVLNRESSNLDKFALDFTKIVEKHVDYVIISGYVSILLGRSRVTEDIDMFIKKISKEKFFQLYDELQEKGFWCLNAENENEVFSYLRDGLAIRFSRKELPIPNFEVKFPKDFLDEEVFKEFITVILPEGKLKISSLERNIAFKRYFLMSDKDEEDALHLERLFKDKLDYNKVNKIRKLILSMRNHGK